MITFLIVVAYLVIAGFTAAVFYSAVFAQDDYSDGMEWPVSGLMGLIWPLVVLVAIPVLTGMYFHRKIVAYNKKREAI